MGKEGHLVHVDFGDCFEVAMHRSQFTNACSASLACLSAQWPLHSPTFWRTGLKNLCAQKRPRTTR